VLFDNSIELPGIETKRIGETVKKFKTTVVLSAHERCGSTLYNTLFTIGPDGSVVQKHRKVMPTYTERMIWGMGDGSTLDVYASPKGVIGGLICWEHWMPALRIVMHEQQELIHVAQWPWVKEMNHVASRQYAFEGGCFVLAAGAILRRSDLPALPLLQEIPCAADWLLEGGSAMIAPDGSYIAEPVHREARILVRELDTRLATEAKLALDSSGHYSRPDLFQLRVDRTPKSNLA
jgi:predicted amidohydrolase